ncbi:MAG TPA: DNA polymerase Y family protein [Rhizomicrobium sp.]|nr:DNA polymerase Y family protein [Rhizomicrobium sp.]
MTRFLCVYLPYWAIERQAKTAPLDANAPFALAAMTSGGWHLAAVNPRAASLGLNAGELLADARARVPLLQTKPAQPEKDRAALLKLARWCTRFSPYVAPWPEADERAGSSGLTLDITASDHLFGGEAAMLRAAIASLNRLGFTARGSIASSIDAAHALAKFGAKTEAIVPDGKIAEAIAPLPVSALRIPDKTAATLKHLGLKTVGHLLPLPRAPLTQRFGRLLNERLDQALGRAGESFSPLLPHAPYRASATLAEPISSQEHILALAKKLATDLAPVLEREGKGARALRLTLFRVDGETGELEIRLARPSRETAHIVKLFSLKLDALAEECDAGFGFEAARLDVTAADRMAASQATIAADPESDSEVKLSLLIDHLGSRLGLENVLRAHPRDTHIPERAFVMKPAAQAVSWDEDDAPMRPLLMLPCAEPAEVTAVVPEGPPLQFRWRGVRYSVTNAEGPERIRPEWWRDPDSKTRDYYTVEDEDGRRFWLYRDGPYGADARWFVHGVYA